MNHPIADATSDHVRAADCLTALLSQRTLYGLPCANCRCYYESNLAACPVCRCGERIPPKSELTRLVVTL